MKTMFGGRLIPETALERALVREAITGQMGLTNGTDVVVPYAEDRLQLREPAAEPTVMRLEVGRNWTEDGEYLIGYLRCEPPDSSAPLTLSRMMDEPLYRMYFWVEEHTRDGEIYLTAEWKLGEPVRAAGETFPPALPSDSNRVPHYPVVMSSSVFASQS